jgi:hypothetical protein
VGGHFTLLPAEEEVARHHHGAGGDEQAEHRLGAFSLQRLVEEAAHRQGQGGQGREARIAGHEDEHRRQRQGESGEDQ